MSLAAPDSGFIGDDIPPDGFRFVVDAGIELFCSNDPLPTGANSPLSISGTSDELIDLGLFAESSVTVSAFLAGDTTARATTTSDAQGLFALSIATDGLAHPGYLLSTHTGFLPTYAYPAVPYSSDIVTATSVVVTSQTLAALASAAETNQDPSDGILAVRIVDCVGQPIAGARLTSPSGALYYVSGGMPSITATATDASGLVYIFDVPPGDVTISGTYTDVLLRSHVVQAYAGALTLTDLQP
jgi:hypothetical protein